MRARGGGAEEHVVGGLGGAVDDLVGHVAQIHGLAVLDADHDRFEILGAGEEVAGVDADFLIVFREAAGLQAGVCGLQTADDGHRRKAVGVQLCSASTTRMVRGRPPMTLVSETSGICSMLCWISSAMARS